MLQAVMHKIQDSYNTSIGPKDSKHCTKCRGRGDYMEVFWQDGIPYEAIKKCECSGAVENERRLQNSGLTSMKNLKFDNYYVDHEWQRKIKDLAEENASIREWFYIGGQVGSGKTHICSAICNYIMEHGGQVKYSIWTDDIQELKGFEQDVKEKINKLKTVEVLYIDDLYKGRTTLKDNEQAITFQILNYRYNNNLKTIISSERTIQELLTVDEATASRIKQKSGKYLATVDRQRDRNLRLK